MGKNNQIFERIEKKYIMSKQQYEAFREGIKEYMQVDQFGKHTICNIYFDTDQFDLIRRSIESPAYKEKLRLRSYGVPTNDSDTFIEIKKKWAGVVYKRRVEMPLQESREYIEEGVQPTKESQIQKEIDYFIQFYKPLPKVFIGYDRIAMFGKEDSEIRITFDFDIRTREYDLDLSLGDHGEPLLNENEVLMEIKIGGAYPIWLGSLLNHLRIYPTSFSKYGTIYKRSIANIVGNTAKAVSGQQAVMLHDRNLQKRPQLQTV
ncbi:MAG: polyphosphate polymerase domain-containing protein [Lachnospiraceae bacterium]